MNKPLRARRSPGAADSRATAASRLQTATEASAESATDNRQDAYEAPALFDAVVSRNAYGCDVRFDMPKTADCRRGSGGRPRTTGPADARAPQYWIEDAERTVLALVDAGHQVTSDDLHRRFSDEPSATGAAFGALFKRMAARGQLVLLGHRPSTRPEARGRVVGIWAAGVPS